MYFELMMKKDLKENVGIRLLIKMYRKKFRIPENLDYYSKSDYKIAEWKFVKYALLGHEIEFQRLSDNSVVTCN
jgi:hypothetical protein